MTRIAALILRVVRIALAVLPFALPAWVGAEPPVPCCRGDGSCVLIDVNTCVGNGGNPLPSTTCEGAECRGACCAPDGGCVLSVRSACDSPNQRWNGPGSICATSFCLFVCCRPDLSCFISSDAGCQYPDFRNGDQDTCSPTACLAQTGACCLPGMTCTVTTECACTSNGGAFYVNQPCPAGLCPETLVFGACCFLSDNIQSCTVTWELSCGGDAFHPGESCAVVGCGAPILIPCCCRDTCLLIEQGLCGSAPAGAGACAPNPCGTGACCDEFTGGCIVLPYLELCSGIFFVGGSCEPNNCPPPATGACCDRQTDACAILTLLACMALPGRYEGDNRPCEPLTCAFACCLPPIYGGEGSVCRVLTRSECTARAGTPNSNYTVCGPDPANPTFCCPANFNHTGGISVDDIYDYLAAYFGADPRADFNRNSLVSVQDVFDFLGAYFAGCH